MARFDGVRFRSVVGVFNINVENWFCVVVVDVVWCAFVERVDVEKWWSR
jgi:hypothetical protein